MKRGLSPWLTGSSVSLDLKKGREERDLGRDGVLHGAGLGVWCAEAMSQHEPLFTQPPGTADRTSARQHSPESQDIRHISSSLHSPPAGALEVCARQ